LERISLFTLVEMFGTVQMFVMGQQVKTNIFFSV